MAEAGTTRIRLEIDASGAVRVAEVIGDALKSIGDKTNAGAQAAKAGLSGLANELQKLKQAADVKAFGDLSGLQQKIAIQKQALQGAISLADAERRMAEVDLRARGTSRELATQLAATQQQFRANQQAITQMGQATHQAGTAFVNFRQSVLSIQGALAGLGVFLSARAVLEYADTYRRLEGQLKLVTASSGELSTAQERLFTIAQSSRQSFEATITTFARAARAQEQLGVSQEGLFQVTEALNLAVRVGGATAVEASTAIYQLSQAFASGTLQGDEFRTLSEALPGLLDLIAKEMGVTRGELKQLGSEGKITGEIIARTLTNNLQFLREEAAKLPTTVGQAFTVFGNALLKFIGEADSATGVTSTLGAGIILLANNLDVAAVSLAAFGAVAAIANMTALIGVVTTLTAAVATLNTFILANPWVLAATAIALAVGEARALTNAFGELQAAMQEAPTSLTAVEQALVKVNQQIFDLRQHIEFVRDHPLAFEGVETQVIESTTQKIGELRQRLAELTVEWKIQTDAAEQSGEAWQHNVSDVAANERATKALAAAQKEMAEAAQKAGQAVAQESQLIRGQLEVLQAAETQHLSLAEAMRELAAEELRFKGFSEEQIEDLQALRAERDLRIKGFQDEEAAQKKAADAARQLAEENKRLAESQAQVRAQLQTEIDLYQQVQAGTISLSQAQKELVIQKAAVTAGSRALVEQHLREKEVAEDLAAADREAVDALIARNAATLQVVRQVEISTEAMREETRIIQHGIAAGRGYDDILRDIAISQKELELRTARAGEKAHAQAVDFVDQAAALAKAREGLDKYKDSLDDAFLTVSDIGRAFDEVITGILQGTQSLGESLEDLGEAFGAKFFKAMLVGKGDFDRALIGNITQLVGLPSGGLLGALFGQGGQAAGTSFFSGLLRSPAAFLFGGGGAFGNVIAGGSSTAGSGLFGNVLSGGSAFRPGFFSQGSGLFGGSGFGAAGGLAGLGAGFFGGGPPVARGISGALGAASFIPGPQQPFVAGAAILASLFGGDLFGLFKPGRIAIEKKNFTKFFEKVFEGEDFKVLKESQVASGLLKFGPEARAAGLTIGALYAEGIGKGATQGTIVRVAGQFLGNLERMGKGSEEAKAMLQQLAQAITDDLGSALTTINSLTTQFSKSQGNNLLSIEEFEEEVREAKRNLKEYGDTTNLTVRELQELALAHGNTGSFIVTYNDLLRGAIELQEGFTSSAQAATLANHLIAEEFSASATEAGLFNEEIQALTDRIEDGSLTLEEAIVALNGIREAAGLAKLELSDFTVDPTKVVEAVRIIQDALAGIAEFGAGLIDTLVQNLFTGLDVAGFGAKFDEFFDAVLRTAIVKALIAGFVQGLALETLRPFFEGFSQLITELATGAIDKGEFATRFTTLLAENAPAIEAIRTAFAEAGPAIEAVLALLGIDLPAAAGEAAGAIASVGTAAAAAGDAIKTGLSESLSTADVMTNFTATITGQIRDSVVQGFIDGFLNAAIAGTALQAALENIAGLIRDFTAGKITKEEFTVGVQLEFAIVKPALEAAAEALGIAYDELKAVLTATGLWKEEMEAVATAAERAADRTAFAAEQAGAFGGSFKGAVSEALKAGLADPNADVSGLFTDSLHASISEAITSAVIDGFVNAALTQGALGPALAALTDQINAFVAGDISFADFETNVKGAFLAAKPAIDAMAQALGVTSTALRTLLTDMGLLEKQTADTSQQMIVMFPNFDQNITAAGFAAGIYADVWAQVGKETSAATEEVKDLTGTTEQLPPAIADATDETSLFKEEAMLVVEQMNQVLLDTINTNVEMDKLTGETELAATAADLMAQAGEAFAGHLAEANRQLQLLTRNAVTLQLPTLPTGETLPSKASGGPIGGSGPQLIIAHGGEFMMNEQATQKHLATLALWNAGQERIPSFQHGGLIGGGTMSGGNWGAGLMWSLDQWTTAIHKSTQVTKEQADKMKELRDAIDEIIKRRFSITTSLAEQFGAVGAISPLDVVTTKIAVLGMQLNPLIAKFAAGIKLSADDLREAEDLTRSLRDLVVERYQIEKDALQQIQDGFKQAADSIRGTLRNVLTTGGAPVENLAQLAVQAAILRDKIATAPQADQPQLLQDLAGLLQQQLQTAGQVFSPSDQRLADLRQGIIAELSSLAIQADTLALDTTTAIQQLQTAAVAELQHLATQEDALAAKQQALLQAQLDQLTQINTGRGRGISAASGYHGTIAQDTAFYAHAGERVDIGRGGSAPVTVNYTGGEINITVSVSGGGTAQEIASEVGKVLKQALRDSGKDTVDGIMRAPNLQKLKESRGWSR